MLDPKLVKYPFLRSARDFLVSYPLDDEIIKSLHGAITDQARYRLSLAVRNKDIDIQDVRSLVYLPYERRTRDTKNPEDLVEFYSYFVAVLASKNEPFLTVALSKTEASRAKKFFVKESPAEMVLLMKEAVDLKLTKTEGARTLTCTFVEYLKVATEYELTRDARWKLVNQPLDGGMIRFTLNDIQDLFAALVQGLMISGMRGLRSVPVPPFVRSLVEEFKPFIPRPSPRQQNQYNYIQRLLEHPITDGRHRVIWLILAPYFATVKGMDEASATDAVLTYIGDARYKRFIQYNVKRAIKGGLLPLSEQSIRTKHPDILGVLPREVFQSGQANARPRT